MRIQFFLTYLKVFSLLRYKQWIKNGFVFAPLLFTANFTLEAIFPVFCTAVFFCIAASAVYILNDLCDQAADQNHPKKSITRPLASGRVSRRSAWMILTLLYGFLIVAYWLFPTVMPTIYAYVLLNVAYTFVLKHQPVIDIFTIAIGFVLRVYAGAQALAVPVSGWMFVTTLCLALYLAAIKRRQEINHSGSKARTSLNCYTVALLDRYAEMSAMGAIIFYGLFVMSTQPALIITIPLILFGIFRYWYVVEKNSGGESPTDVFFEDYYLIAVVLAWVVMCAWVLSRSTT